MGSSFGGNVALQLALRHPDRFRAVIPVEAADHSPGFYLDWWQHPHANAAQVCASGVWDLMAPQSPEKDRSEEHTSELQSRQYLVCRLLLEKKNNSENSSSSYWSRSMTCAWQNTTAQ